MKVWSRAILLIDMDAFFAAVEQKDHPHLRGKPIGITNGIQGSTLITCSYEARAFGIKTGMKFWQAKKLCPNLIAVGSRPDRYAEVSRDIMTIVGSFSPDLEVFSIDEAFLDITRCQRLHGDPQTVAYKIQEAIFAGVGLTCSIGVSGDKTTAKYAAKLGKPNGCTVIPPWQSKKILAPVPVESLCGIGPGIARFLNRFGVKYCGDMPKIPMGVLAKRFGPFGRRLWLMCQGMDPYGVVKASAPAKSMGHGKILPPGTSEITIVLSYFRQMCERLAARMRRHQATSDCFFIGMRVPHVGWLGEKYRTEIPIDDGFQLYQLCLQCMRQFGSGYVVKQVQVTALILYQGNQQYDLFASSDDEVAQRNQAMDQVNQQFGAGTLIPAGMMATGQLTKVIAPSWKPEGVRDSL